MSGAMHRRTAVKFVAVATAAQLSRSFRVFETVRDNAQRQGLCPRQRRVPSGPVGERGRSLDHLSEPAAVPTLARVPL
jgi:hypothetical protein